MKFGIPRVLEYLMQVSEILPYLVREPPRPLRVFAGSLREALPPGEKLP